MSDSPHPAFIQLNAGGGQPRQAPESGFHPASRPGERGPIRVPPGMAPGINPTIIPEAHPGMRQVRPSPPDPSPPTHAIPRELRARSTVQTSDIRNERLTEADARQRLSSWVIYQIEKADSSHEVDAAGYPLKPTWENVTFTEETNLISQHEATRRVRELQWKNQPLSEEKANLSANIQRQLVKLHEMLQGTEPDTRYSYTLIQLQSDFKNVAHAPVEYYSKGRKGKKYTVDRKKSKRSPKYKQRVAVTAYFLRAPALDQSALSMLRERESDEQLRAERQRQPPAMNLPLQPRFQPTPQSHNPFPPPVHQHMPHQTSQLKLQPPIQPGDGPGATTPRQPTFEANRPATQLHTKPGAESRPVIEVRTNGKGNPKAYHGSAEKAPSSVYSSDEDSVSDRDNDPATPPSSISSRSPQRRGRSRYRPHESMENFGYQMSHQNTKEEVGIPLDGYPKKVHLPPVAHQPVPPIQPTKFVSVVSGFDAVPTDHIEDELLTQARPSQVAGSGRAYQGPAVRRVSGAAARQEIRDERLEQLREDLSRIRVEDQIQENRRYHPRHLNSPLETVERRIPRRENMRNNYTDDISHTARYVPSSPAFKWPEQRAQIYMADRAQPLSFDSFASVDRESRRQRGYYFG